jgi:outer membrane protein
MKNALSISLAALAATSLLISGSALAYEAGDWRFTAGMTSVDPEQDNGSVAGEIVPGGLDVIVDDDTTLTFTGAYMFTPAWGVELLASLPYEHDFTVGGLATGSTKHLPPTLTVQYRFNSAGKLIPYLGLGVNYTLFFSEKTTGQLESTLDGIVGGSADLDLDNSVGVALQAGVDYMIDDNFFVNLDLRYISIEPDAEVNGIDIGTVDINPTLVGLSLGYRF